MTLELLAALVAAVAMAGIGLGLRRMSGGRLPRWFVPVAAGAGLLGFTLWNEYSWFGRVSAALPPQMQVVWQDRAGQPLRPWTYILPLTTRFVALDRAATATNPAQPDVRMATLHSFARWQPVQTALVAVNCPRNEVALIVEGATLADDGTLTGAAWTPPLPEDATAAVACERG
jgi:hypothetical protein